MKTKLTDEHVMGYDHRDDDASLFRSGHQLGILEQRNFDVKYLVCRHQEGSQGS